MLMNYRCPGCGNTMEFSPSDQKMYCVYCGSSYSTEELNSIIDKTGLYDRINNNAQYQDTAGVQEFAETGRASGVPYRKERICPSSGMVSDLPL